MRLLAFILSWAWGPPYPARACYYSKPRALLASDLLFRDPGFLTRLYWTSNFPMRACLGERLSYVRTMRGALPVSLTRVLRCNLVVLDCKLGGVLWFGNGTRLPALGGEVVLAERVEPRYAYVRQSETDRTVHSCTQFG